MKRCERCEEKRAIRETVSGAMGSNFKSVKVKQGY